MGMLDGFMGIESRNLDLGEDQAIVIHCSHRLSVVLLGSHPKNQRLYHHISHQIPLNPIESPSYIPLKHHVLCVKTRGFYHPKPWDSPLSDAWR